MQVIYLCLSQNAHKLLKTLILINQDIQNIVKRKHVNKLVLCLIFMVMLKSAK